MIEERRPNMWWSASTTMRLAHTPVPDTQAGGTPIRMYRQIYINMSSLIQHLTS
jgi:hypothetical protein